MLVKNIVQESNPKVYIHTEIASITKYPRELKLTTNCQEADVVLLSTLKNIPKSCQNKIWFGTKYSHLKNEKVIGSFFWQKGRPNILFYKSRLKNNAINLDASFDKYIEQK